MRPVGSLLKRKRQFAKPPLHAILFDIREVLPVHTWRAPIGAAQSIGMRKNISRGISCRTEHRSGSRLQPSLSRVTPSAVSEHFQELIGCPISWSLATCCVCLELRLLPSTGITRLRRYYGPLRHPRAPGLSLAGVRLIVPDHAKGLPVLRALSLCTCCRHYPGAAAGRSLRSNAQPYQPSPARLPGRPAQRPFRGLHGVHLRCGLHTRAVTYM